MKRLQVIESGTGVYYICQNKDGFWGIEKEYLGSDGCLKRPINGVEGGLRGTLEEAIAHAVFCGKVKEWRENNPKATDQELMMFMMSANPA